VYRKVIVGYEGSGQAEDALALGGVLAKSTGATLVVSYVHQEQPRWTGHDRNYQLELRDRIQTIFERAREQLPDDLSVETVTISSTNPSRGLTDVAKSERDALLVLGPTHRGAIGRVTIGGVAEQVLEAAPCAVAVAPRGFDRSGDGRFRQIGVAFDGSPESTAALGHAGRLAAALSAELQALSVVGKRAAAEEMQRALETASEETGGSPPPLAKLDGDPASALSKAAQDLDLLVTGSRGRGPRGLAVLGSVSAKLMRTAPCPVLVVPRGQA
jgi:nucleotide-binding universal stress UspA family protein